MKGSMRLSLVAVLIAALFVGSADARRKATKPEKRAIAQVFNAPPKCAKIHISTVNQRFATYRFNPRKFNVKPCEQVAADGVAILKQRRSGRWRIVTAGSAFDCPVPKTPRKVVKDLRVQCH